MLIMRDFKLGRDKDNEFSFFPTDSSTIQCSIRCQEQLREKYKTKSKVKITPWDPDDTVDIDEIYIQLSMLRDHKTPRGITKEKLQDYAEMFKGYGRHPNPKRILVYGRPGIGKSTFTQKIAVDWARGEKEILKKFDVLLLINLRDVCNIQDFCTMLETADLLSADEPGVVNTLYEYIRQNQEKVLLVLDGYDEYSAGESSPVDKILRGSVLGGCCVLFTTRPVKERELRKLSNIQFELNGLDSEEQVKKFASNFLSDQEDVEELVEYLRKHDLWGMAEIPLLLTMLCLVWMEKDHDEPPASRADLFDRFMQTLLKHLLAKDSTKAHQSMDKYREELSKLGEPAFDALLKNQLYFKLSERPAGVDLKKFIDPGFLQPSKLLTWNRVDIVYFLHKSVQEFLAAQFIVDELTRKEKKTSSCLSKVDSLDTMRKVDEVLKFVCELSSDAGNVVLSHLHRIGEKEVFKAYNVAELLCNGVFSSDQFDDFISLFSDCLFCCAASDRQAFGRLFHKWSEKLRVVVIQERPMGDWIMSLSEQLKCLAELIVLNLAGTEMGEKEAIAVARCLKSLSQLKMINLSSNPLGHGLIELAEHLKCLRDLIELDLSNTEMGEEEARAVARSFPHLSQLKRIGLSYNPLGLGIIELAKHLNCLPRLTELRLLHTEMGEEEARAVARCLPSLSQLTELWLSFNPLGHGIVELAERLKCVSNLTELLLRKTGMDKEQVSALARALKHLPKLRNLDLALNPLGRGVRVLIQHLSSVPELRELNLSGVRMTKSEAEDLGAVPVSISDYHVSVLFLLVLNPTPLSTWHCYNAHCFCRLTSHSSTIPDKSLGTNLHFWRIGAHARRDYEFTCLTSLPTPPPPIQC